MRRILLTTVMLFALGAIFGVQNALAQFQGTVIYTQGPMTGVATVKGTLWKNKWMTFEFDFPNGKPGFNIVQSQNLSKFKYTMTKPDGTIMTDISQPDSQNGKYIIKFKLKSPWSNSGVKRKFKMVIWLE